MTILMIRTSIVQTVASALVLFDSWKNWGFHNLQAGCIILNKLGTRIGTKRGDRTNWTCIFLPPKLCRAIQHNRLCQNLIHFWIQSLWQRCFSVLVSEFTIVCDVRLHPSSNPSLQYSHAILCQCAYKNIKLVITMKSTCCYSESCMTSLIDICLTAYME